MVGIDSDRDYNKSNLSWKRKLNRLTYRLSRTYKQNKITNQELK